MYIRYGSIWHPLFLEIQSASLISYSIKTTSGHLPAHFHRPLELTEASNLGEEDTILTPS